MKTPKPAVDHTAAYMNKGITNNASKNAPKGVDFGASETSPAPMVGVGMTQHKRKMGKTGDRFASPHEHMNPTASIFHKIGR